MTHINAIRFMHFTTGACFINFFLVVWKKIYEISAWGPPTGHDLMMTAEKRMEKKDIILNYFHRIGSPAFPLSRWTYFLLSLSLSLSLSLLLWRNFRWRNIVCETLNKMTFIILEYGGNWVSRIWDCVNVNQSKWSNIFFYFLL